MVVVHVAHPLFETLERRQPTDSLIESALIGPDWTVVDGIENGLSQIARKAPGCDNSVVWNFPVDISFKSTNAHGWPRMSVSIYGVDSLGRDVVRGYGSVLLPPSMSRAPYVTLGCSVPPIMP